MFGLITIIFYVITTILTTLETCADVLLCDIAFVTTVVRSHPKDNRVGA